MPVVKVVGQEPPETMMDGRGFLNRFGTITEGAEIFRGMGLLHKK